jgi:hypothetical protein
MSKWKCRALRLVKDNLFDPDCVPFNPSWTVGFNSGFPSEPITVDGCTAYETGVAVRVWVEEHANQRVVVGNGEVICEDETDATLLYVAFR